ncbi:hypothetical protein DFJ73DRAFT_924417 [Zopfochytrium polystomum]|nr:hypothetical protein DFJ73DRAFT_924417 [Zopfochytrium polystomum]
MAHNWIIWRLYMAHVCGLPDERHAVRVLAEARDNFDSNILDFIRRLDAKDQLRAGAIARSLEIAEELIDPTDPDTLKLTARGRLLRGDPRGAIGIYQDALRYAGEDWAETMYQRALSLNKNEASFIGLGRLYASRNDDALAAALLAEAVELSPKSTGLLELLGQVYSRSGEYEKATDCFRRIVDLEPFHYDATLSLATLLLRQHQLASRRARSSSAAAADSAAAAAAAEALHDEALAALRTAVVLSPGGGSGSSCGAGSAATLWNSVGVAVGDAGRRRQAAAAAACFKVAAEAATRTCAAPAPGSADGSGCGGGGVETRQQQQQRELVMQNLGSSHVRTMQYASAAVFWGALDDGRREKVDGGAGVGRE